MIVSMIYSPEGANLYVATVDGRLVTFSIRNHYYRIADEKISSNERTKMVLKINESEDILSVLSADGESIIIYEIEELKEIRRYENRNVNSFIKNFEYINSTQICIYKSNSEMIFINIATCEEVARYKKW